ncbi:MAG TPA: homoserine dehydrogenase [Vicinamibacterales bacterium]|nr:homoserine dehydrogenase [Vicinamibacterales bacterium]
MTTSVLDRPSSQEPGTIPAVVNLGLLGFGTIGSAVARLSRAAAADLHRRGVAPVVRAALVRNAGRSRSSAALTPLLTSDVDQFFAAPIDLVVEALGNAEPARTFVARALESGIPVVTANKTLVAAHGDELFALARQRGTALRYEATCLAGVPFLGTFERRPLAARVRGVTGILNGTSNAILSALSSGITFETALADAQRRGLAEPDPSNDVSGADAAQKLAILVRLFGERSVDAAQIPATPLDAVDVDDVFAAAAFGGHIKPLACASWTGDTVRAFVSPTFVDDSHALARVSHVTNGVVLEAEGGRRCFIGPGAGPDVTAATLLDDVVEIATERPPVVSTRAGRAASVEHFESGWFVRIPGDAPEAEIAELLGSFGVWCARLSRIRDRRYALTFRATRERATAATAALAAATHAVVVAVPAVTGDTEC